MNHDALLTEGWQRQTTIDEPRLSELAENYRALGYEVLVVHEGVTSGCGECYKGEGAAARSVGSLYIRRTAEPGGDDDELFSP